MVANVFKYRSDNLIILNCCVYFGLLDTIGVVIQKSMKLMRNTDFGSWIDRWLEKSIVYTRRGWECRCQMVCDRY